LKPALTRFNTSFIVEKALRLAYVKMDKMRLGKQDFSVWPRNLGQEDCNVREIRAPTL
jgi:hypothetical protein